MQYHNSRKGLKMKASKIIGAFASLAGAGAVLATPAMAGGNWETNDYMKLTPLYVQDAPAAGYSNEGDCSLATFTFEDKVKSYGGSTSTSGCWKGTNGRWTYGSMSFDVKGTPNSKIGAYHKYTPVKNLAIHFSTKYNTESDCERYRLGNITEAIKHGAKPLQVGVCSVVNGSRQYSYGSQAYQTTNGYRMYSGDVYLPNGGTPYNQAKYVLG